LIGGGMGQQQSQQQPGGDLLGGILGSILGGGGAPQGASGAVSGGSPLTDILGGILGGGSGSSGAGGGMSQLLAPVIEQLAKRLGLPPAIAQVVVSFLLGKLFSGAASSRALPAGAAQPSALDLDGLLSHMDRSHAIDQSYLASTGMPQELAAKTGMDVDMAATSLQEAFRLLGGGAAAESTAKPTGTRKPKAAGAAKPKGRSTGAKPKSGGKAKPAANPEGLDDLLKKW